MRQAFLLLTVLVFYTCTLHAAEDKDYIWYHEQINRAERVFFLDKNYDSAKAIYLEVFESYEFSFLRDCLNAAQLAILQEDWPACKRFLEEGFENGLKPRDLKPPAIWGVFRVTVFDSVMNDPERSAEIERLYLLAKPKYLSRIDIGLRLFMDSVLLEEQLTKNNQFIAPPAGANYLFREGRWDKLYDSLARTTGYPGQRLIGRDDSDLYADLELPEKSTRKRYDMRVGGREEDYNITFSAVGDHAHYFGAMTPLIPALHHSCIYTILMLHAEKLIARGDIHPRELAILVDHFTDNDPLPGKCFYTIRQRYYVRDDLPIHDRKEADANRQRLHIVPLKIDEAKRMYGRGNGARFFNGFFFSL